MNSHNIELFQKKLTSRRSLNFTNSAKSPVKYQTNLGNDISISENLKNKESKNLRIHSLKVRINYLKKLIYDTDQKQKNTLNEIKNVHFSKEQSRRAWQSTPLKYLNNRIYADELSISNENIKYSNKINELEENNSKYTREKHEIYVNIQKAEMEIMRLKNCWKY